MPDVAPSVDQRRNWPQRLSHWLIPSIILLMAAGIVLLIAGNWNAWVSERPVQKTDDAYVRADLTPLSTKVAGLVAEVCVSDYQPVKAGDLLVQLQDDDFRAHVQQAEAAVSCRRRVPSSTIDGRKNCRTLASFKRTMGSRQQRRTSPRRKLEFEAAESAIANARSAISTGLKRRWSEQRRSAGGRRRCSRPSPQPGKN